MIPRKAAEQHGLGVLDGSVDGSGELISKLRSLLPGAITEDGRIDVAALQRVVGNEHVTDSNQKHELRFAGKGLANHLADSPTSMELSVERGQSKDFDTTSNVVIRGDNLDVLKILHKNYHGSIKAIYIDPPYNTGKDDFVYNDYFKKNEAELIEDLRLDEETIERFQDLYGTKTHSGWLAFMWPRLKAARDLLTDDGVIFISIDDNEQSNLKLICDEIFAEENFIANMVRENKVGSGHDSKFLAVEYDYITVFAKNIKSLTFNKNPTGEKDQSKYNKSDKHVSRRGKYKTRDLDYKGTYSQSMDYPITLPSGDVVYAGKKFGEPNTWRWSKKKFEWGLKNDFIVFNERNKKVYLKEYQYVNNKDKQIVRSVPYKGLIRYLNSQGTTQLEKLLGRGVFPYPKSVELLAHILSVASGPNSIILDFFAGSGTTGEAVMTLNAKDGGTRKFILVQIDEEIKQEKSEAIEFCKKNRLNPVISSITLERLDRAGEIIKKDHPNTDVGYKVFSIKLEPEITIDGSQALLSPQHTERSIDDTLFNMLCATGKPLDTPVKTVVEGKLYEADGEMYVLGDVDLSKYRNYRINVDGWGEDNTLEQYLNLPRSNVEIIY